MTVFQEDFERERGDRAQAQAAKDDIQKKYENERRESVMLRGQITGLQRQLKMAEENVQQAYRQQQNLQQEVSSLKAQVPDSQKT